MTVATRDDATIGTEFFAVSDQTTHGPVVQTDGQTYEGPVSGLTDQFIVGVSTDIISASSHNVNVTAEVASVFIKTGSGDDAIDVSKANGNNVLDGGTGSNFLTGGTGNDTFFVDDRDAAQPIWSTIVNFHSGDNATIWGVTRGDFTLSWADDEGAVNAKGLTGTINAPGQSTANFTLAGMSQTDLSNGKLSISYGSTPDQPGLPGSNYMLVHAN